MTSTAVLTGAALLLSVCLLYASYKVSVAANSLRELVTLKRQQMGLN